MARKKVGLDISELEDFAARFDGYDSEFKRAIEAALLATKREINNNLQSDMVKHNQTHETVKSLDKEFRVNWEGNDASVKIGFRFPSGLPSIFLMYGTPRMPKDSKLYNDVYGASIKKKAKKLQAEAMEKVLKRIGGN